MADFCKQCSIDMFGEDSEDLTRKDPGLYPSICEGCGLNCIVDNQGKCVSAECLKCHGTIKFKLD